MAELERLDLQMRRWTARLRDDLLIVPGESERLATAISDEVHSRKADLRRVLDTSEVVPFRARLDELRAFQLWMDTARSGPSDPAIVRAQVITQNYICFVYLGDALFWGLRRVMAGRTSTHKCADYLVQGQVRDFRNAIAHANWRYADNFRGLECWVRRGRSRDAPLEHFHVPQVELDFWQALARCTAYAAGSALEAE